MRFRLALGVSAMVGALALPAAAYANGDTAISDPLPGAFRLNSNTLEPGCFVPGRNAPADVDAHFTFDKDGLATEAHVTVSHGASFSVDQVLVPSLRDGYRVINEFDTGTANDDVDIDPGQTATGLTSPTRFLDQGEIIVCVSDHPTGDTSSNEPYNQEAGGLVSAKNRPIVAPHVTALGMNKHLGSNTFRIGFGYSVDQWYTVPSGDPEALFNPDPSRVLIAPRPNDFAYDAQRVNDVDESNEAWRNPDVFDGQTLVARKSGDTTAWLTRFLTQGDLPYSWTLRPSLAPPSSMRADGLTDDQFRAWNKSWQDYYRGAGPKPSMPLAPDTNSPAPDTSITVIVNQPEVRVGSGPQVVVSPAPVTVVAPAAPKAAVKKVATAKQRAAYKRCVKKAKAKHSRKARAKAKARCARMAH
jgi:hypothetical protein